MFDSARRKTTATGPGAATTSHPMAINAGTMNHWAWTGWMPEDGHEPAQPAAPFIEDLSSLMAA
ncbi:hypothetical protein FQ154_12305 [Paeniglutamicibacter gangotriensis]|uniref:Uncharacterized protein n=1 Tax=Paeniglutamicibacter gangotriensis TaxID=254787 RepID=A0A5B0EB31_9MICC|nr:hypothetical protein [Paeniglutamicibacter gangotriensis]KAA0976083.1 hypothetical protein FQ154_12305 [Paeniglutamicibacter gangotriensis]